MGEQWMDADKGVKNVICAIERDDAEDNGESVKVPKNYDEAMAGENKVMWEEPITKEFQAMKDFEVYKEISSDDLLEGEKPVMIHTLFSVKKDGTKKVRTVLAGNMLNNEDVETYSPASKIENVKLLFILESKWRKVLEQRKAEGHEEKTKYKRRLIDFKNAFINASTHRRIVARPPRRYYEHFGQENKMKTVWVILKSLYGAPEAPREWYELLCAFLLTLGMERLESDACLFKMVKDGRIVVLMNLHVDDMKLIGESEWVDMVHDACKKKYQIKDLGDPVRLLGIEIKHDDEGDAILHQAGTVQKMLDQFGMHEAKESGLPHEPHVRLPYATECVNGIPLRSLVGSLLYVSRATRPDICYDVMALSRHLIRHDNRHFLAGKKVLRYLKRTRHAGLLMKAKLDRPTIEIFCDADHSGDHGDPKKRSITGFVIYVYGALYGAYSLVQKSTALSACDAELIAASEALIKGYALAKLLVEMNVWTEDRIEIVMWIDNQSAMKTLSNVYGTSRTRHVEIKMAWIRDLVERGIVKFRYVASEDNDADVLTKPMPRAGFNRHVVKMMNGIIY
jgi:hypothetical protein